MPSRVIIIRVKKNTPKKAARPTLTDVTARRPSISCFIRFPARHMCTVSDATRTAAVMARRPSHRAWLFACAKRRPAATLRTTDATIPMDGRQEGVPPRFLR